MKNILTSLLFGIALMAQQQSNDITLNVVVKDKKGVAIKGLTAADFEITDGGSRQTASKVSFHGAASPEPRLITLVFENLGNVERRLARQIALDLLKEASGPNIEVGVFMISNQLSVLQPFTADKEALKTAVELATSGSQNIRFTQVHAEMKQKLEGRKDDPLARMQLAMLKNGAIIDDGDGSRRSILFLDSLASGMAAQPGRKTIAYLTWGLIVPTFLDVSFEALQSHANRAGVAVYGIDCRGVSMFNLASIARDISTNGSNPTGSGTENNTATNAFAIDNAVEGLRSNIQANLRVLSEATGGMLIADTNDPKSMLRQLVDDSGNYYEIVYDPAIAKFDGAMRKTNVKVTAKDARIRDRSGYFAMRAGQEDLLPYEVAMLEVLNATPLPRDVEFRSGVWKVRPSKGSLTATVAIEVPLANIKFGEDSTKQFYLGRLNMLVQVKDPATGKVIQKFTRDLPLRGKLEQLAALKTSNFNFREQVTLPPGRYVIEAVVTDQLTGKVGARKTSFLGNAPASGLALSSVSVVRNFQPNAKDLKPDEPYQFQGGRITPTLNTSLKVVKGAQMALFFIVYPDAAASDAPEAVVQYIKDGEVAGSAKLQLPAAANGRIPYVLSSPLDAMPPGMYEVKVTVKQGTTAAAQESVFLTIES